MAETVVRKNTSFWRRTADGIESFCSAEWYPFAVVGVAFLFHAFALDLAGIVFFAAAGITLLLLSDGCKASLPVLLSIVFIVSTQNSPGYGRGENYYATKEVYVPLAVTAALLFSVILFRTVKNLREEKKRGKKTALLFLLFPVLLGVSFLTAGVGGNYYPQSALFGGVQTFFFVLLPAFFFAVLGKDADFDFLSRTLSALCLLVSLEVAFVYFLNLRDGGSFGNGWKSRIVTGWGVSNVSGELIVLFLPFAIRNVMGRRGEFYLLIVLSGLVSLYFTLNRTGMIVGVPVTVVLLAYAVARGRRRLLRVGLIALFGGVCFVGWKLLSAHTGIGEVTAYFEKSFFFSGEVNWSGRDRLWGIALDAFRERPLFGAGYATYFMESGFAETGTVFEALMHCSALEALGSAGLFGGAAFAAYCFFLLVVALRCEGDRLWVLTFLASFFVISLFDIVYFIPYCTMFVMLIAAAAQRKRRKTERG